MGPKYEFIDETKNYDGHTLHRIRRLSDGKIGGWIEKESNLSQEGNCWVDDEACVCGNAKVYDNAQVRDNAEVHGYANIYGNAYVYGNAHVSDYAYVYGNAKVYDNACVYGGAHVYGDAWVYDDAWVSGNAYVSNDAKVYGEAKVYGNANVYGEAYVCGNAKVSGEARIYSDARVYGNAWVSDNAWVYGNAQVYGNAWVRGGAVVEGNAEVDYELSSGTVGEESTNEPTDENTEALKDFVYKIDNSAKLDIQSNYDSVDAFFEDDSDDSYVEHKCLTIVAVDTKVPILKLEKAQVKDQNVYKFIVDIINEDGAEYSVKDVIDSKDKFDQLLKSTLDALNGYPQFSKYADDLENCL